MPRLIEYLASLSSLESKETTPLTLVLSGALLENLNVWQATSGSVLDEKSTLHYLYQWLSVQGKRVTQLTLQEYNPVLLEKASKRQYARWISNYNKFVHDQAQKSQSHLSYHWGVGEQVDKNFHYEDPGFVGVTRLPDPLRGNERPLATEPHSRFLNTVLQHLLHVRSLFLTHCAFSSERFSLSFEKVFPELTHFSQNASQMPDTEREAFFAAHPALVEVALHQQLLPLQESIALVHSLERTQHHLCQLSLIGLEGGHKPQKSLLAALVALDAQQEQALQVTAASAHKDYTVSVQTHLVTKRAERKLQAEQEAARQKALEEANRQAEIVAQERAVAQAKEARIVQLLSHDHLFEEAKKAIVDNPDFLKILICAGNKHTDARLSQAVASEWLTWSTLHLDYENQLIRVLSADLAQRDDNLAWEQVRNKMALLKREKREIIRQKMAAFYREQVEEFFEEGIKDPELYADKIIQEFLHCPAVDDCLQNDTLPGWAARQVLVAQLDELVKKNEEARRGQKWCEGQFQIAAHTFDEEVRMLQQQLVENWLSVTVPAAFYKEGKEMRNQLLACRWLQKEVIEEHREGGSILRITRTFADLDRLLLFAWGQYQTAEGILAEYILESMKLLIERGAWPHVVIKDQDSRGSVHHQVTLALATSRLEYKAREVLSVLNMALKQSSLFDDYTPFGLLAKVGNGMKKHVDDYTAAFIKKVGSFSFFRFFYHGHYKERAEEISQHHDIIKELSNYPTKEAMLYIAAQGKSLAENAKRGLFGNSKLHVPLIAEYQKFIDALNKLGIFYEGYREAYHAHRALLDANSVRASTQDVDLLLGRMHDAREAYQAEVQRRTELDEERQARAEAERKHQEEQRVREETERKLQEEQRARQAAEAETRRLRAEVARLQGRGREDVLVLEEELNDGQGVVPSMFFSPIP